MKDKKSNTLNIINIILLIIAILTILFARYAYSKIKSSAKGKTQENIAEIVCEMEVNTPDAEQSSNLIHPYCDIVIKNYKSDGSINGTKAKYEIKVVSADGEELPDYYWKVENGDNIKNDNITGIVETGEQKTYTHRVVFTNDGTRSFNKNIDFKLEVSQSEE